MERRRSSQGVTVAPKAESDSLSWRWVIVKTGKAAPLATKQRRPN
jgi:hypothetical protein